MVEMVREVYSEPLDEHRAAEVFIDDLGEYWVGVTVLRDPKDWEFHPRAQFGVGEVGMEAAIKEAQRIALGVRRDLEWLAR